jgi:hypothetical protein
LTDQEHRNVFEYEEPKKNIQLVTYELSSADMEQLSEEEIYLKLKTAGFDLHRPITVRADPKTGTRTFVQGEG